MKNRIEEIEKELQDVNKRMKSLLKINSAHSDSILQFSKIITDMSESLNQIWATIDELKKQNLRNE